MKRTYTGLEQKSVSTKELFDAALEIKEVTSKGEFSGYGSVFNTTDQGGDIIVKGAFVQSLAELKAKGRSPAMLWQHKSAEPCGVYTTVTEDSHGLYIEGQLALKTQRGAEAYELMQMKALSGLSIGFITRDDSYDQKTGVRTIKQADLWEISLVTFPMNDDSRIQQVKSIEEIDSLSAAERFLRESGSFSRAQSVAIVSRIKSLSQSESAEQKQVAEILASITKQTQLLRS